jgi:hypothetical protein
MRNAPGARAGGRHGQTYLAAPDVDGSEERTPRPPQAAANTYRIAFDPHAGLKVLTLRRDAARAPTSMASGRMWLYAWQYTAARGLEQSCRTDGPPTDRYQNAIGGH